MAPSQWLYDRSIRRGEVREQLCSYDLDGRLDGLMKRK
jgi:hypothetical protein